jgi:hypothetical protein
MNAKRALAIVLCGTFFVLPASAQMFSGRLTTSFYAWERFDTVGSSNMYLRAFQNVQMSLVQGDFSLQTFAQGATNFANSFGDVGRVRVYNLYLTWANIGKALDLNLGRQAVYAGVGVGSIDGVVARARFADNSVSVTGYGGATVDPSFGGVRKNMHDNYHFGGQIVTTAIRDVRAGISYTKRLEERDPYWTVRARDTSFSAVPYYVTYDAEAQEYLSADVNYSYTEVASIYGRYDHDLLNGRVSRAQGGARVQATKGFWITADFIHRVPRISYNSIFSAFVTNSTNEIEGGVEYAITPMMRVFGRLAHVSYTESSDAASASQTAPVASIDDKSMRWSLGLNSGYGTVTYSGGSGFAGELQSFSVQGTYPISNSMIIPTAGISYASYRLSADDARHDAFSVLLGAIMRPMRTVSVDVQGQWLTNKTVGSDLRMQVKLMYWFAQQLSSSGSAGKAQPEEGKQ